MRIGSCEKFCPRWTKDYLWILAGSRLGSSWDGGFEITLCRVVGLVQFESDIRLHLSLSPFDIQILEARCRHGEVGEVR